MIASTSPSTPLMMEPKSDVGRRPSSRSRSTGRPRGRAGRPRRAVGPRFAACSLVASTMSVTVRPSMPPGLTSSGRCSVTAPRTRPSHQRRPWSTSARSRPRRPARRCSPRCTATSRHRSGSWSRRAAPSPGRPGRRSLVELVCLPTAETSRSIALKMSIVGLSSMNDSNVVAPIRSPAAAKIVFGFLRTELVDRAGVLRAAPGMSRSSSSRPWKSLVPMIWMSTGAPGAAAWAGELTGGGRRDERETGAGDEGADARRAEN